MQDITELQQRLAAALDRIEADVEQLARPAPPPEPVPEDPSPLLISDLVVHVELEESKEQNWGDMWDLARFWSKIFRE